MVSMIIATPQLPNPGKSDRRGNFRIGVTSNAGRFISILFALGWFARVTTDGSFVCVNRDCKSYASTVVTICANFVTGAHLQSTASYGAIIGVIFLIRVGIWTFTSSGNRVGVYVGNCFGTCVGTCVGIGSSRSGSNLGSWDS